MKKAIWGIIENQTYDEPAVYGHICLSCQQEQERDHKLEQKYFEKLNDLGLLDDNGEIVRDPNGKELREIMKEMYKIENKYNNDKNNGDKNN